MNIGGGCSCEGSVPRLYTVDDAAEILRVSKSWLYRELQHGRLPATRIAGRYLFTEQQLERIIKDAVHGRQRRTAARTKL